MIKIMLVCNAGMSTSMLMNKMVEAAKLQEIEAEIWAIPDAKLNEEWKKADVILLGPQVSYLKSRVETVTAGSVPVEAIPMLDYGRMNGPAVLAMAVNMKK
ncbi:Oligo-beta-mannoside-specific phosphotransferase enzyme IIB component [Buttiauxella agrestis]|uniref:Oligo-beta-mannoside-specific phosphotransferase enzyme IIB component n=1 Tax=Buttiauxella agrestis TaxID=82977 RepID=A0A381C652_9ENTR|nr:PTS sugar transporter subunit IIB [Buttiauxella agrestis]SUW62393.1 Oligo-beta-mannoside-specific phosphotransferase enzyme IIB component [Buttiauxella agrestis]